MIRSDAMLLSGSIDRAIGRALACLRTNFRTPPSGRAGWYHYLDDPSPGVTASAVGLYCFHLAGAQFERMDEVIRYLLSQQVDQGTERGGWPVRTTSGMPIVEATAWVVRSLSCSNIVSVGCREALSCGSAWLERNQNVDFGWGSYKGQPSRVFTTALSMLALTECGASREVIANGQKWLNDAQSPDQAAWGMLPGAEPTILHTSIALMALLSARRALSPAAVKQTGDWLIEHLNPAELVERPTIVEEYDIPYPRGSKMDMFQNSLPHFAAPVALVALLAAGTDPLQRKIFDTATSILQAQETDDSRRVGAWELPRSPLRPSIWAIWPFVAALTSVRRSIFPSADLATGIESRVILLYPGCAIIQTNSAQKHLTRRLLIRNAFLDWLRSRKLAVGLWLVALLAAAVPLALWAVGQLTLQVVLAAMLLPLLLVTFQLLWDRRNREDGGK